MVQFRAKSISDNNLLYGDLIIDTQSIPVKCYIFNKKHKKTIEIDQETIYLKIWDDWEYCPEFNFKDCR